MLNESLIALAAAGGTAVVQAAGTEAWGSVRDGVVRIFRRRPGRSGEDDVELDLERTELVRASQDAEGNSRQASLWEARFSALLGDVDDRLRQQTEAELRQLIALVPAVADRYPVLHVHDNTYDKSPQQYGNHNHMQNHYGSDT
ncbi:hypothetical protein HHL19_08225 [Streptomyces sp. R302]|uniref:hypothetical protein n=1 Tax=unclassified Streptomyces TaxID=2593676 RepID=UPI00145D7D41|nr:MULTISPECIES: hypothetical protein [unclassified Streptomyces]NML52815.1 hypothetical protein [Streptomyces sp. R301]NML78650.1 hypothetical protein [Streptomyces sp. R302]